VPPPPRTVLLSRALYPLESIEKARAAYNDLCRIELRGSGEDLTLTISPLEGSPPETSDEFLNYALCAAAETHLASSH
jgi:hypothetical protein